MTVERVVLLCLIAGCADDANHPAPPVDPCAVEPSLAGGAAEVGLGSDFTPLVEGQDVHVELGIQGLYMFVVNVRVQDMDVSSDGRPGVIYLGAFDQSGQAISLETGCRVREFGDTGGGHQQLSSPYFLPLIPDFTSVLEGAMVTIRLDVRDLDGHQAKDERTVVTHLPAMAARAMPAANAR